MRTQFASTKPKDIENVRSEALRCVCSSTQSGEFKGKKGPTG